MGFCALGFPWLSRFATQSANGRHSRGISAAWLMMRVWMLAGDSLGIIIDAANSRFSIIRSPITGGHGRRTLGARAGIAPGQLKKTLA
jgi:hypothetical protein